MSSEISLRSVAAIRWRPSLALWLRALRVLRRFFGQYRFNSITRRIIVLNFFGVAVLVAGILYLNQYRVRFMQTRVDGLTTQAEIIASAIGQMSKNNVNGTAEP